MEYLFSYGSNNPQQLFERLNKKIDIIIPAYYPNHKLAFGSTSKNWLGGVGTMIPIKKNSLETNSSNLHISRLSNYDNVFGYLTMLSKDDLTRLDVFEAVKIGKYVRKMIEVITNKGETIMANAYFLTPKFIDWKGPPSQAYLEAIFKTQSTFWKKQFIVISITRADTKDVIDEWSPKIYIFNTVLSKIIKEHVLDYQDQITTLSKFNILGLNNLESLKKHYNRKNMKLKFDIDLEITKLGYLPFKKNLQKEIEDEIERHIHH
jgi:hypothetical protein